MFPEKRAVNDAVNQVAITAALPDTALIAQLESEIRSLRGMSALMDERFREMREDRDAWRQQAQQLALPMPRPEPGQQLVPVSQPAPPVRRWWRRAGG